MQRGLRHRRRAEHQQQIGEARSGLQLWCHCSKSDSWLSVRGASAEEVPRQQASFEWLGHVRSVTHYGERDKLESMETLMGLWVPHCGLSNEKALCPQVPPF